MPAVPSFTRTTIAGALACLAIVAVGVVDYLHSRDAYSAAHQQATFNCFSPTPAPAGNEEQGLDSCYAGLAHAQEIQADLKDRVLLDATAFAAIVAVLYVVALRERPDDRARVSNNLGIAGVSTLVATAVVAMAPSLQGFGFGAGPWAASAAMLLAGGIGRLAVSGREPPRLPRPSTWQVWAALGVTAIVALAAFIYASGQPPCGGSEPVDPAPQALMILALVGLGGGLVCLATRHWVSALTAVTVNPAAILAIAAASCAFY